MKKRRSVLDPDVREKYERNGITIGLYGYTRGRLRRWYVVVTPFTTTIGGVVREDAKSIEFLGEVEARAAANAAYKSTATNSDPEDAYQAAYKVAWPDKKE